MATLSKRMRGGSPMFEIQFYAGGTRKTIPLGKKYTEKTAGEMLEVVESLLHCLANGIEHPSRKTAFWIETASEDLRQKLVKAGLLKLPEPKTAKELWTTFLSTKRDIKGSTREITEARSHGVRQIDRHLRSIALDHADFTPGNSSYLPESSRFP